MESPHSAQKITDPKVALTKAEHYCAYQDRAQQEVRNKLYDWGLWPNAVEQIIATLVEHNFLNEERFASSYVKGKFNQKSWGRIKIKQGLKFKKVPDKMIAKALQGIDGDEYFERLKTIIQKKEGSLTERNALKRKYKLQQYALSRGYENDLIAEAMKSQ